MCEGASEGGGGGGCPPSHSESFLHFDVVNGAIWCICPVFSSYSTNLYLILLWKWLKGGSFTHTRNFIFLFPLSSPLFFFFFWAFCWGGGGQPPPPPWLRALTFCVKHCATWCDYHLYEFLPFWSDLIAQKYFLKSWHKSVWKIHIAHIYLSLQQFMDNDWGTFNSLPQWQRFKSWTPKLMNEDNTCPVFQDIKMCSCMVLKLIISCIALVPNRSKMCYAPTISSYQQIPTDVKDEAMAMWHQEASTSLMCCVYLVPCSSSPPKSSRKGFSGLTRVEYYFAMHFCSYSGMFNLVLNPSVLFFLTLPTSFGRLFQFEITSGKNELASCVVEMVLDVTSYCSSWERRKSGDFLCGVLVQV